MASATLMLPKAMQGYKPPCPATGNRILVVLALSGGNDGWNSSVPYRHGLYYQLRPSLAIPRAEVLPLSDEIGLHPALTGLRALYEGGALAVLHGVGLPHPERAHFRATQLWQTAGPSRQPLPTGWIGRYLDVRCPRPGSTARALEAADVLSLSLKGIRARGTLMGPPRDSGGKCGGKCAATYPDTLFGQRLKAIATRIISGADTSVYCVSLDGFDTHVNQAARQQQLLKELGDGLLAFSSELKKYGRFEEVLVMTVSEFGRQLTPNLHGGTDHGTANCMFFISGGLRQPGILNLPDLDHLDPTTGDPRVQVDFRQVYATVLRHWMKADDRQILKASHECLSLL